MVRYSMVVVTALWAAGSALPASWADAMFEELSHDFGSVPRGPTLTHQFRFTNNTKYNAHVSSVRVSCGCVSASATQEDVAPGQTGTVYAQMDSRRFSGIKTVTIFVQFDRPQFEEVRLWVQANGRDDMSMTPDTLAFGQTKRGSAHSASVNVNFFGSNDWRITEATCESNYVKPTIEEVRRANGEVAYKIVAKVRADTPVGKWYTDVWLKTNNSSTPRIRVPLTIEIDPALTVTPSVANLGEVKAGTTVERKVIVRGEGPFRIKEVKGTDARLQVQDSSKDSKPVHVLTVKLQSDDAGNLNRTLRIVTDMKDEGEVEFKAVGQVIK